MSSYETGRIGEDLACGYLVNKNYKILGRNYSKKFGEIDVIAKSPDKTLVFIEVKTIKKPESSVDKSPASYPHLAGLKYSQGDDYINPEDNISISKFKRFKKISEWYVNNHPGLASDNGYQMDVLAITLVGKTARIKHYKNISL